MESLLASRFNATTVDELGLTGLYMSEVECRQSICRVEIEWPSALAEALRNGGYIKPDQPPLQYLVNKHGPLASLTTKVDPKTPPTAGTGRSAYFLMFGPKEIAPRDYTQWARGMAREYERRRQSH